MKFFDKIEKKDLIYWIIILILFIVVLLTKFIGGNGTVVDYFSFAGTITSILLAAIAIFYSFVQNFSNEEASRSLTASIKRIEDATYMLERVGNIEEVLCTLERNMYNKLDHTKQDISESIYKFMGSEGKKVDSTDISYENVKLILDALGKSALDSIYYLYMANQLNRKKNISDFTNWYNKKVMKNNDELEGEKIYYVLIGRIIVVLHILRNLGIIEYKIMEDEIELIKFNEHACSIMEGYVKEDKINALNLINEYLAN